MASYSFPRIAVDHARYWRGAPHVWSTTYFLSGTTPSGSDFATLAGQLVGMENEILFPGPTGSAGFLEVRGYGTGGGAPAYVDTYGTLADPGSWNAYAGTAWSTESGFNYDAVAENAWLLKIPLAGLSSTGKPVFGRKYYHSIPSATNAGGSTPDISGAIVTALQTATATLNNGSLAGGRRVISNAGRLPSSNPVAENYFVNHQMPRGRKRTISSGSSLLQLASDAAKLRSLLSKAATEVPEA